MKEQSGKKEPTSNGKASAGRNSKSKAEKKDSVPTYSDLVNLNLIKKFDINDVLDQTGNSNGDCHLPRGKFKLC